MYKRDGKGCSGQRRVCIVYDESSRVAILADEISVSPFAANRSRASVSIIQSQSRPFHRDATSGPRPGRSNCAFLARRFPLSRNPRFRKPRITRLGLPLRRAKGVLALKKKKTLYSATTLSVSFHASRFHDCS